MKNIPLMFASLNKHNPKQFIDRIGGKQMQNEKSTSDAVETYCE